MIGKPLISVIIPAFNAEGTIRQCVESVLALKSAPLEIIIIDDGSTDKTGITVDQIASEANNCIVVHQSNMGRSTARNRGVSLARAPWVTFLDADDLLIALPDVHYFYDVDYQSIWCGYTINGSDSVLPRIGANPLPCKQSTKALLSQIVDVNTSHHTNDGFDGGLERSACATFYSRKHLSLLNYVFNPDLDYAEDMEFNIRFLQSTTQYLGLPLVSYDYQRFKSGTMKSFDQRNLDDLIHFSELIQMDLQDIREPVIINALIGDEVVHQIRRAGRYGTLEDLKSVANCIRNNSVLLSSLEAFIPPRLEHRILTRLRLLLIKRRMDTALMLIERFLGKIRNN